MNDLVFIHKTLILDVPRLMGIVNLTPDSFSDGGIYNNKDQALKHIDTLIKSGADIIDIGAESTRPGAATISCDEEIQRLDLVLKSYKQYFDVPLSIDTTKAEVANFALNNGADLINDVSGLALDNAMLAIIKKHHCPCVIMHSQKNPVYSDVLQDIHSFFEQQIKRCLQESITQIILDPGIGFDKNLSDNLQILKYLDQFKRYGYPILIGTSRKSFIEKITGDSVHNRLEGSIASNMLAYQNGASIFRVHDVASIKKALQITQAILKS